MLYKLLKTKIYFIVAFLFIALSNVYITSVSSLSPAYLGIILSIVSLMFFFNDTEKFYKNRKTEVLTLFLFLFFIYLVVDCIVTGNSRELSYYLIYFFFNHFMFILGLYYFQRCDIQQIKKIIKYLYIFSVIIFLVDFVYRVTHSVNKFSGVLAFYNFKYNDLMFLDSNWPGFMAMLLFSLMLYLKDNGYCTQKKVIFLSFLLVCQTISRAAIVCCILVLIFSKFLKLNKGTKILLLFFCIPILLIMIIVLISKLTDLSFLSKLELIKGMLYYLTHFDLGNLLWGNYPDACHDNELFMHTWIGGHLYMTRYIDFGFYAFFFEAFFLVLLCFYTHYKALYVIIPFIIAGLSFAPWNLPYMYVFLALIFVLENSLNKKQLI